MNTLPPAHDLLLFMTAAIVLLVIPGPAVLYIIARSIDQGRKAGIASCSGIATGGLAHVLVATLGLSALLVSSAMAYSIVKYAGATYLIYLGIKKLRERHSAEDGVAQVQPASFRHIYTQGILVQVLNPKTAIFLPASFPPSALRILPTILAFWALFTSITVSMTRIGEPCS